MKKSILILVALVPTLGPIQAKGGIILEAAWVNVIDGASAGTKNLYGSLNRGLGIPLAQLSEVFDGQGDSFTHAFAKSSAIATFNGGGLFLYDLGVGISSFLGVYPRAQAISSFNVEFLYDGVGADQPVLNVIDATFTATNSYFTGFNPFIPHNSLTNLGNGRFRASTVIDLYEPGYIGGSADWGFSGSMTFPSGSIAPGFRQQDPILPTLPRSPGGGSTFTDARSGRWYDPPVTDGYTFQTTDGSKFTDILNFPSGFDHYFSVLVGGNVIGSFGAGDSVNFQSLVGADVTEFQILGISPNVDAGDPLAFPIQLAFSTPTASFTMNPVPEPATAALLAAGAALCLFRRERKSV